MALSTQIVSLNLAIQRGAFNAKDGSSLALVPFGVSERCRDMFAFHLVQCYRAILAGSGGGRAGKRREHDILVGDLVSDTEHDGPLDVVTQFANIPGPVISH